MSRLPPLNALRAFEAAARYASFKRAAAELCVTDGAISRHVAQLEAWLGTPLFHRLNRQVALTAEGRALFSEVSPALSRIALAASELTSRRKSTTLVVSSPPTFTMRWLIPRLSVFLRKHPNFDVKLTTSISPVDFVSGGYDMAIRRIPTAIAGLEARPIVPEMRLPICTPGLMLEKPLDDIADLEHHTLIHTATAPSAWPDWLDQNGCRRLRSDDSLSFEEMYFSLQAAGNGLGIAIAPGVLVVDDAVAGRLALPFPTPETRRNHYHAIYPRVSGKEHIITTFYEWMVEEGLATMAMFEELLIAARQARAESQMRKADLRVS